MTIDLLFRGGAIALMALMAIVSWRAPGGHRLFAATYVCGGLYLLTASAPIAADLGPLRLPALALASTGPFWFLIATRRAFGAATKLQPLGMFAPAAAMAGLAVAASAAEDGLAALLWGLLNLCLLSYFLAALFVAWAGLADDLDPRRRTHRLQLLAAGAGLGVVLAAGAIGLDLSPTPGARALLELGAASGTFAVTFGLAMGALRLSDSSRPKPALTNRTALAEKILAALNTDRLYRDSDLTNARLAQAVAAPEGQVRQAINAELGAKNFSEFVNGFRLAESTAALADPGQAEVSIATIALDAGFGSIASFNRVFKTVIGVTPSDYRRQTATHPAQNQNLSSRV
jgi:AraC-like DNA-binding protein